MELGDPEKRERSEEAIFVCVMVLLKKKKERI